jgi:hypothetical protein
MANNTNDQDGPKPRPEYMWITSVPQDWFALIVRGGDLHRIIHGVKGWYVDDSNIFRPEDTIHKNVISAFRAVSGREFVGIPRVQGLYVYKFAWNKYWRKKEGEKEIATYEIQAHDSENIIFTPFESQYPILYEGIEVISKGMDVASGAPLIPIGFEVTVRVRMTNPRQALMRNVDWFGNVLVPDIQTGIKNFAGEKTYEQLIKGSKEGVAAEFITYMMGSDDDPSPFRSNVFARAGVEIIDIGVTNIIPNKDYEEALVNLGKAQQDAQSEIAKAEGEKQSTILKAEAQKQADILTGQGEAAKILSIAEAESKRIDLTTLKVAGGYGDNATTIEKFRQIHGSGLTTYIEDGAKTSVLVGTNGKPVHP